MADTAELVEKREALAAKQDKIREVLDLAGGTAVLDFSRKSCLEKLGATDSADASVKWRTLNREAESLGSDLSKAEDRFAAKQFQEREEQRVRPADHVPHPGYDENGAPKSWAQQYVESKAYKMAKDSHGHQSQPFDMEIGLKTLFETGAGFAIENRRSGLVVDSDAPDSSGGHDPELHHLAVRLRLHGGDHPDPLLGGTRGGDGLSRVCLRVHAGQLAGPEDRRQHPGHR